MKQLSKCQSILLLVGSALMVVGVILRIFLGLKYSAWIFFVGALVFAVMQMQQSYDGNNMTIRRLRKILTISDVLFVLSSLFMIEDGYNYLLQTFCTLWDNGYIHYVNYIHNNWVVILLVAAVLELYSTHRIANELEKEEKNAKSNK